MEDQVLEISERMAKTTPTMIVGHPRSGSSLLYRTLQKHSSFAGRQVELSESGIFIYSEEPSALVANPPPEILGYMLFNEEEHERFLLRVRALRGHKVGMSKMHRWVSRRSPRLWAASGGHLVVRCFYHHAQRARGCRRLIDKPNSLRLAGRVTRAFPQAKLLYIHRHPVDVYSSYIRRAQIAPAEWLEVSRDTFCKEYIRSTLEAVRIAARNARLLLVRYEDFVRAPSDEFQRICQFLGEPYEPGALVESTPDLNRYAIDRHLFGKITVETKNWRDYLSLEEAAQIEKRLRSVMHTLHYDPYSA